MCIFSMVDFDVATASAVSTNVTVIYTLMAVVRLDLREAWHSLHSFLNVKKVFMLFSQPLEIQTEETTLSLV